MKIVLHNFNRNTIHALGTGLQCTCTDPLTKSYTIRNFTLELLLGIHATYNPVVILR